MGYTPCACRAPGQATMVYSKMYICTLEPLDLADTSSHHTVLVSREFAIWHHVDASKAWSVIDEFYAWSPSSLARFQTSFQRAVLIYPIPDSDTIHAWPSHALGLDLSIPTIICTLQRSKLCSRRETRSPLFKSTQSRKFERRLKELSAYTSPRRMAV
ncbi:hypothetical protein PLICRDRAFT_520374 [Plicaturopsis crispa FD-325 SS-3]|nr:hypothetical protein PLICRDRAFT_520374 [Plicaturopsis crispa FD-325 SS-3]